MKVTLRMADIEVEIDDPECKERGILESEALGCIESLMQYRVNLQGSIDAIAERADDDPGQRPEGTEHQIKPEISMSGIYA